MFRMVLGLAIIASITLIGSTQTASASHPKVTIEIGTYYFCDPEFQLLVCETDIAAGTTVTWDFLLGGHTTTDCGGPCGPLPPPTPLWDSGLVSAGGSYSFTFNTPGVYSYFCSNHSFFMFGQINVGPAGPAVGGVAEIDSAAGAGLDASASDAATSSVATALAIATAVALVAGLIGTAWFARRRLA